MTGVFVFVPTTFFAETAFLTEAVLGTVPLGAALSTAGATATFRSAFFAARFTFAQRAFCAAAILARASSLTVRFAAGLAADFAGMKLVGLSDNFARDGRSWLPLISGPAKSQQF